MANDHEILMELLKTLQHHSPALSKMWEEAQQEKEEPQSEED